MTPIKGLDPEWALADALLGAQELAHNFAPTARREADTSPNSQRLAHFVSEVLSIHIGEETMFVREGNTQASSLDVLVAVDGLDYCIMERRESRLWSDSLASAA